MTLVMLLVWSAASLPPATAARPPFVLDEIQQLDGTGNNEANPAWGQAGGNYSRVAPARYADGAGEPVSGPDPRYVSNRVFNDSHQNLFSERNVTQWGLAWGQFLDHTFGLRLGRHVDDPHGELANIPFDHDDPIEEFANTLGFIHFERSAVAPGTGVTSPREQINTVSSYIDGWPVYGGTAERLEWMREGPVDGDMSNNGALLLLPGGYLPRREARSDPASAPEMELVGFLASQPHRAVVAGDIRANENLALTATHTLFAREHNRLVGLLPSQLSAEEKFQIARRLVIAQQQHITYNEFLPALGVRLPPYTGHDPTVNTDLSNEFATVGYRAHSMIHGEFELETNADRYTEAELEAFEEMGLEVEVEGEEVEIAIPLALAFANPDLLEALQLGPMLQGLGLEAQYRNDEQIDNQLRSVLFEIPVPGNPECLDGPEMPACFDGVLDLGAIDVERGRDHGIPGYNELRQAYGLEPVSSFTEITGEETEEFPADPELTPGAEIDDPASLEFLQLFDIDGNEIELDSDEAESSAVTGIRRTTLAARLKAIYGSVDQLDAFTGMISEEHVEGSEFGQLQLAIWTREFQRLRDGDRFFYGNDPTLQAISRRYRLDYRRTLADVIADNTDIPRSELSDNVFIVADDEHDPASCAVTYQVAGVWPDGFIASATIVNQDSEPIEGWELSWSFATGQVIEQGWNGHFEQVGHAVTVTDASWNRRLEPNGGTAEVWFLASWDGATNAAPTHYTLNGMRCALG